MCIAFKAYFLFKDNWRIYPDPKISDWLLYITVKKTKCITDIFQAAQVSHMTDQTNQQIIAYIYVVQFVVSHSFPPFSDASSHFYRSSEIVFVLSSVRTYAGWAILTQVECHHHHCCHFERRRQLSDYRVLYLATENYMKIFLNALS